MARAGQTIDNPITGERIVFRNTAAETAGAALQFDFFLQPGKAVPVTHIHTTMEERFEVIDGQVRVLQGRTEQDVAAGGTVTIPRGTPHRVLNHGGDEAHMLVEFNPAGQAERFFEIFFALCRAGKVKPSGQLTPYQAAVVMGETGFGYLAAPPILVQRALFALLRPIGRLRGDAARFRAYAGSDD